LELPSALPSVQPSALPSVLAWAQALGLAQVHVSVLPSAME
jgi:hypothetical protein